MRLVFLRHGQAMANFPGGDADRPLSPQGQRQAEAVAGALRRLSLTFSRLFASPLKRAQETAQVLVEEGLASHVEPCPALLPESGPQPLQELLAALPRPGTYGFVGHEPLLSEVMEILLFGQPRGSLAMPKGAVAILAWEEGAWRLEALASPRWFLPGEGGQD
jgi:phosphohistidine phosphatase